MKDQKPHPFSLITVTAAELANGAPFNLFVPGDKTRAYKVGEAVEITTSDKRALVTRIVGRDQGHLARLAGEHAGAYAPCRHYGGTAAVLADMLERNGDLGESGVADLRDPFTVLHMAPIVDVPAEPIEQ